MKQKAISAAQNLASDINCLLGKCKNKTQETKLNSESTKVLSSSDFESKKYIDDPYVQMQLVKNSDKDVQVGENGGAVVSVKIL
jgi:hypothetical protein